MLKLDVLVFDVGVPRNDIPQPSFAVRHSSFNIHHSAFAMFDMSLIQRGARLRRSPYFEATLRSGCRGYTVYNHMFLPIAYEDRKSNV